MAGIVTWDAALLLLPLGIPVQARHLLLLVIPAKAGLRRQDAEANIRAANGPKGKLRMQFVIQFLLLIFGI